MNQDTNFTDLQEYVTNVIDGIKEISDGIKNFKDTYEKIIENNPIASDLKDSVGTLSEIATDIRTQNYAQLLADGIVLGRELSKVPGDIKELIDTKGGEITQDALDIKDDVIKLVDDLQKQFAEISKDIQAGGLKGFIAAIQDLATAVHEDLSTLNDIGHSAKDMVSVLESKGNSPETKNGIEEQEALDQAKDIGSHMSGASDMKDAGGKDGQQSPNTPVVEKNQGQGQDIGI